MSTNFLSIPGMVSGLPTQSIIQQLVAARQMEETPLKNQQTAMNNQSTAWNSLSPGYLALQTALQTLVNPSTWNQMSSTSSNSTAIAVTTNSGATAASYSIKGDLLAQGQADASVNLSPTNVGVASTFQIQQNGHTATVNVNSGDSMATIASSINTAAQAAGVNVSASVFTNADGTAKLMVSSTQTGAANAFTMSDVGTGNFVSNTLQMSNTMVAQDAKIEVNGVSVTSSTNTFNNVIGGLNVTLNQTGVTSVVNVSANTQPISDAVNGFMNAYNSLVKNLESVSKIDTSDSTQNGALAGDNMVQSMLENLETSVGNLVPNGGTLQGLASIGIVMNKDDGTLMYDTTTANNGGNGGLDGKAIFNNELATDIPNLKQLIGVVSLDGLDPKTGLGAIVLGQIKAATSPVNGIISNEVSSLGTSNKAISDQLTQMDDANTQYQQMLQDQFNAMETQISAFKSQQQWLTQFVGGTSSSNSSGK